MEIDGIPLTITHNQLENTVCKIVNSVNDMQLKHLEACHRITARSATTILKQRNEGEDHEKSQKDYCHQHRSPRSLKNIS